MSEEMIQSPQMLTEAELIFDENFSCVPSEEVGAEHAEHAEAVFSSNERVNSEAQSEIQVDLKEARLQQWRDAIESDLQLLIVDAAKIRKNITDATTKYKKEFYTKKFNKVSAQVRQHIAALQRLGSPILPEGTDNGNDTTTVE